MKKVTISIKGSQGGADDEEEAFELMTDGEMEIDGSVLSVSYIESELTGYDGLPTTFKIEPDRVVLTRGGGELGDMIFSESQKQHFLYNTPFGAVTMGIDTQHIRHNMTGDGGCLEIRYAIDVDNMIVSRNSFRVEVKSNTGSEVTCQQ